MHSQRGNEMSQEKTVAPNAEIQKEKGFFPIAWELTTRLSPSSETCFPHRLSILILNILFNESRIHSGFLKSPVYNISVQLTISI